MRSLRLTIAYDGTAYCGWQIQANGDSIQQRLERGWFRVTGEDIRMTASGRTDAGVHAEAQVCSLRTDSPLSRRDLLKALNAETPFDISILSIDDAPDDFHAIRDATGKTYRYQIQYGRIRDPLKIRHWWHVHRELDIAAMKSGAEYLIGTHDFASFQSAGAERDTTIRTVDRLELKHDDPRHQNLVFPSENRIQDMATPAGHFPTLLITISADGFLYKMVRNIVGSLVRVGERKEKPEWIQSVLEQRHRGHAGQAAPAHGLYLQEVRYPIEISNEIEISSEICVKDLKK